MGAAGVGSVLALLAATFAGCLAPDDGRGSGPGAVRDITEGAVGPLVLTWDGHLRAGAGYEVPAHVEQTAPPFDALGLWSSTFKLVLDDTPADLELRLEWGATAAQLLLMAVPPEGERTDVPYESEFTDRSPICFRIPPEGLRPGTWGVMVHSAVAVEAALRVTVTVTGAPAHVVDEPFRLPADQFARAAAAKTAADATGQQPEPLACEAAYGAAPSRQSI